MTRPRPAVLVIAAAVVAAGLFVLLGRSGTQPQPVAPESVPARAPSAVNAAAAGGAGASAADEDLRPTEVYAHNLLLRKGPQFRVYVRWIRGQMLRTHKGVNPSFDDPESFLLEIHKGVVRANIGDISTFLNRSSPKDAPLRNISLAPAGDRMKLRGTVHKILPLPVELSGTMSPTPDGRLKFHVDKIKVLKIPVKGLMGGFHLELSDMMGASGIAGVQVEGNEVLFDTERLFPPPHIHGQITSVKVSPPDLELIYGGARNDETKLSEWHNFLKLTDGTLDFGKLTMHHVDLTMIDASKSTWFDLDLVNYQAQLVNGYTRITPQAGLEIFMPSVGDLAAKRSAGQLITMDWLRDKRQSVPSGVPASK